MMKRISLFVMMLILMAACSTGSHKICDGKVDLKVLYVGGNPDLNSYGDMPADTIKASVKSRMESFETFLNEKFTEVKVVLGDDYSPEMSNDYDVTVFDGRPKPIERRHLEYDEEGNQLYKPDRYMPYGFDRASVTIGSTSESIALPIGCKNDWYCLCLDARAHNWVADHPIFKGPFPVTMTTEMLPTPEDAKHYTYFYDFELPDSTLMWQVQLKGYLDDGNVPVGMVSRPWGYMDSPDAEYISSGVCAKTIDAVAIGRHGNFLHWGFAAAPNNMTEEAKQVFANAIVYISDFNGKGMLVRKPEERIATREYLKECKDLARMEPYEERVRWTEEANVEGAQKKIEAEEKKARGETLTREEQYYLNFTPREPMTLDEYLKRYHELAYSVCGTDLDAYIRFYDENTDYFYGGKGSYNIVVDEDCKAWGIANNDIRLLEKAISCLEKGEEVERAERILDRYTLCTFTTPQEWRQWFNKYRKKIFFTESGGWYFMVDGDPGTPGNDYDAKAAMKQARIDTLTVNQALLGVPSQQEPVCVAGRWVAEENVIELTFAVLDGFHVYRTVADKDPYVALSIGTEAPKEIGVGEPVYPQALPLGTEGTTVYHSGFTVRIPVEGKVSGPVKVTAGWQACDSKSCTIPQTKDFNFMIK